MEPAEILDLINAALNLDFQLDPALAWSVLSTG
jgi:hypothetical protein